MQLLEALLSMQKSLRGQTKASLSDHNYALHAVSMATLLSCLGGSERNFHLQLEPLCDKARYMGIAL